MIQLQFQPIAIQRQIREVIVKEVKPKLFSHSLSWKNIETEKKKDGGKLAHPGGTVMRLQ